VLSAAGQIGRLLICSAAGWRHHDAGSRTRDLVRTKGEIMRGPVVVSLAVVFLLLAGAAAPAAGQTSGFPSISQRQYTAGTATVTVTGSATINAEIPLNAQASYSDGEVTWLQFGVSGSPEPNALITYGQTREIGITVAEGKLVATGGIIPGEKSECSGEVQVTGTLVAGEYVCRGITSHDPARGMGTVDIKVTLSAKS
jgi:hypothetical protein